MSRAIGTLVVFGLPDQIKPVRGVPDGKVRYRFRADKKGECFVRSNGSVSRYIIGIDTSSGGTVKTGEWYGIKQGENATR